MDVLAIDIGASSGRHMLGSLEAGRIHLEEIYRFPNGMKKKDGRLVWDMEALWAHILTGMTRCREMGRVPASVGVDTWGVDYVLLDGAGQRMGDCVAYRDGRTREAAARADARRLYGLTGTARQVFNTVYQLMSEPEERLKQASRCLLVPDYFHYLLSGKKVNEYTEASTTGLLDPRLRDWSREAMCLAGIPPRLFPEKPVMPGTVLGGLTEAVRRQVGYDCRVTLPAAHDTGSAYMAVPARDENAAYLSSGTWSLLGCETDAPLTGEEARLGGFTNEGGYGGRIRFLRNIMGLWMLQCIRREEGERFSFAEMADMAAASDYPCTVDASDDRFLAPESMEAEVRAVLRAQGAPSPDLPGLLRCVNRSLAKCYAEAIGTMARATGKTFTSINIVGGGSQNRALNQWTADAAGLPVYAGPAEGTALGNAAAQWIALGEMKDLADARARIARDFEPQLYTPRR